MERAKKNLIYFNNIIDFFENKLSDRVILNVYEPIFKLIPDEVITDWKTIINNPEIFIKKDFTLTTEKLNTFIDKKLEQLNFLVYKKIDEEFFMYSEEYHDKLNYLIALENDDNIDNIDKTKYFDLAEKLVFRVYKNEEDHTLTPVYCSQENSFQNNFSELFSFEYVQQPEQTEEKESEEKEQLTFYKDTKNDKYWILLSYREMHPEENQEDMDINNMMKNLYGGMGGMPDLSKLSKLAQQGSKSCDDDCDDDCDDNSDSDENIPQNPLNCMQQ